MFMLGHPVGAYKVPLLALVRQEMLFLFTLRHCVCYLDIAGPGMGQGSSSAVV
jgi:hypothetical protein